MSGNKPLSTREVLERQKAALLREAAVKAAEAAKAAADAEALDKELAELERFTEFAKKHNLTITPNAPPPAAPEPSQLVPAAAAPLALSPLPGMTLRELIDKYRKSPLSTYNTIRFKTREHYDTLLKSILDTAPDLDLATADKAKIMELYEIWTNGRTEKFAVAHSRIAMMRIVSNFCDEVLHDPVAKHFSMTLHRIRLQRPKRRTERMTEEYAKKIISKAHERRRPSIALAQALQFAFQISQKDVIGEWVPHDEQTPPTDIVAGNMKWSRGLLWKEIDDNLVLTHVASRNGEVISVDLRKSPLVMAEINKIKEADRRGPVVICEGTGQPWIAGEYRRWWRKLARAAGVPDTVMNMDSRASEAEADAEDEELEASES